MIKEEEGDGIILKKKYNIREIIYVALLYCTFNIGSGFTSAQEIIQFFSVFGWKSFLGSCISFFLIVYAAEFIIDTGYTNKNQKGISIFVHLGGNLVGSFYAILTVILCYLTYITMSAGASSVLEEYFLVPNLVGRHIVMLITVLSVFVKFESLFQIISYIGRIIALTIVFVSIVAIVFAMKNISMIHTYVELYSVQSAGDSFYGAAILYACVIILLSAQFLFELGQKIKYRTSGFYGIGLGIGFYILAGMIINMAILLNYPEVYNLKIITLYFLKLTSNKLTFLVSIFLFLAMYAGSTTCLWSVTTLLKKKFQIPKFQHTFIIVCLGYISTLMSAFSFTKLVNILYPIIGWIGLSFIILIVIYQRKKVYRVY